jgi:hypothetical protein
MVTHASYYSEEDPTFHRCGRGGHNYPLAQERPENGHGPSRTYGDGRTGDHAQEQEQNTHVRRRIPVAVCPPLSFKLNFMIAKGSANKLPKVPTLPKAQDSLQRRSR